MIRLSCLTFAAATLALAAPATFHKDVLPILQKNCQTCHRPGEVAPFSLMTYSDARPWAKAMKAAVVSQKMPPWFADPKVGHFTNERRLTEEQISTIASWADSGAPEGNAKEAPAPVKFTDATMYKNMSFDRVINDRIGVMDSTAATLCRDNNMPIRVFKLTEPGNIKRVVFGEPIGTIVEG